MKKMEEKKGNVVRHIQSARQWLERAEHAVNSESPTRGDLDLILAKAEVQLAQEKRSSTAELSNKVITYALRSKNMLAVVLGGVAVFMLLIPYIWDHFGQGVNMPAVHSLQTKTQLEAPPMLALHSPSAVELPSDNQSGNSEIPQGEKKDASESPAPFVPATKGNAFAARSEAEPAAAVQSPTTPIQATAVSEQEMRMLVRTAERVLKSTK